MRLLVTGKNGQVGWELQRSLQCLGEVLAVDRQQFDLAKPDSIAAKLDALAPDVIVNAAAYTAVDRAESEESLALAVNGTAPGQIAQWAARRRVLLVHYSTDYVFDGQGNRAWKEGDRAAPLSAYGRTKLAGEDLIRVAEGDHLILRTSWVYTARGTNFMLTMLRLAADRDELRIVDDQWGAPTSARLIADSTAQIVTRALSERQRDSFNSAVLHMTAAGVTTWHGFASAIVGIARRSNTALRVRSVKPIRSSDYPTAAIRPRNSRLDCTELFRRFGLRLPPWEEGLRLCMEELT